MDRFNYNSNEGMWGHAIKYTYSKEDGTMWVGNDEYETQVNFCPMTGKPAEKQMTGTEKQFSNGVNFTSYE